MSDKLWTKENLAKVLTCYKIQWHHLRFIGAHKFDGETTYAVIEETSGLDASTHINVFATPEILNAAIAHIANLRAEPSYGSTKPNPLDVKMLERKKPQAIVNISEARDKTLEHQQDPSQHAIKQGSGLPKYDLFFKEAQAALTADNLDATTKPGGHDNVQPE